jgi:hypothetical protein
MFVEKRKKEKPFTLLEDRAELENWSIENENEIQE